MAESSQNPYSRDEAASVDPSKPDYPVNYQLFKNGVPNRPYFELEESKGSDSEADQETSPVPDFDPSKLDLPAYQKKNKDGKKNKDYKKKKDKKKQSNIAVGEPNPSGDNSRKKLTIFYFILRN
jgi:hypothetical protein